MFDIIIVGAGPAGASAAIFTAKAGKKTLLVDHDKSITKKAWIENHYGAPEISGPDLVEKGQQQAVKHGATLLREEASEISQSENGFVIRTESGEHEAKCIILATGLSTALAESIGVKTKEGTEPRIKTIVESDADGRTNVKGVWAAGTCAGVSVHTIITAGDGAKVAINVLSEMNGERYVDHDILK